MRLHTLELQAIGPYATAQRIDFARLAGSGLFLLEGPTGAGKTTILDAITFALYGGLSGDGSGSDRLHSHFAGPDVEPSVTLEFAIRGVRYRVRRTPEYERPKRRGDGYTTQAAQVHLQRMTDSGWESLSANKAEAGELITDAVGLSREQFTQVMLLPQGQFAKFLRSDDDDRRGLLTRLFGTQLYDRITAELERGRQEASRLQQEARARIAAATAAAAEAAGLDEPQRDELLALSRGERATRLKEIDAELAHTIEINAEALEVAGANLTAALTAAEQAKRQADLMARLTEATARLRAHEATRADHELLAERLESARQAEPVRPLLAALGAAEDVTRSAREAVAKLAAEPHADWLAGALLADGVLADGVLADGQAVDQAVVDRMAGELLAGLAVTAVAAARAAARAQDAERTAASLQHLVDQEANLPGLRAALSGLRTAAARAADLLTALERARQELPDKIGAIETRLGEARLAAAVLATAREQHGEIRARLDAAILAAELTTAYAELAGAARLAVDAHQQRVDAYQRAMEERLENMAAELADKLCDGGACPVCGSTDHPGPAAHLANAVSADDVGEAARQRDAAAQARTQAEADRDAIAAQAAEASAAAGGGTVDGLAATLAGLAEQVEVAQGAAAEALALEPELADLRAEQDELADELMAAATASAAAQQQADDAATELAKITATLTADAGDHPSVAVRQAALRQQAAAASTLAQALDSLTVARAAEDETRARSEQELRPGGFATLAAARAAVLAPDKQTSLAARVASWTRTLDGLTAAATATDLAGLDASRAGEAQAAAETTAAALAAAQGADREVSEAQQSLAARAERLGQRLGELTQAEEAADRLDEETEPVVRLAGLARGMDGHRRIALTTYVLRRWFEQVVQAANVRLAAMSTGRYELRRTDEGESKRQRTGLTLAVIDRHTGEERSPKSLSGGETFYTSLALALGLADVVRAEAGGVELDTLFIDEGFGSLDTETLDQVMAVIDDLRDRGRAVGVVSHVADLKDRVHERLEVRRLPDGSSTATVIA